MRLLIAIPTMDTVPVDFMKSLMRLARKLSDDGVNYEVGIESGTLVYRARDNLAGRAVNEGFTDVLWLDSDMVFEPEIFEDLRLTKKDFVSGIAHGRRRPFSSCLFKNLELDHLEQWKLEDYPSDTFEVAGCGMACCLVSTEIIAQVMHTFKTAFTPLPYYGEDLSFCKRAHELGFRIWAEPTVRLGHIAHLAIWPDDTPKLQEEYYFNT